MADGTGMALARASVLVHASGAAISCPPGGWLPPIADRRGGQVQSLSRTKQIHSPPFLSGHGATAIANFDYLDDSDGLHSHCAVAFRYHPLMTSLAFLRKRIDRQALRGLLMILRV